MRGCVQRFECSYGVSFPGCYTVDTRQDVGDALGAGVEPFAFEPPVVQDLVDDPLDLVVATNEEADVLKCERPVGV